MNKEIQLNTDKILEVLASIKTYSIDEIEGTHKPMAEARKLWNLAWNFKDNSEHQQEHATAVIDFVMEHQSDFGLVQILRDEKMPADARVDFWYKPSYALASILIYYCSFDDRFLDSNPARREAFEKLLQACTGRKLEDHGYEAETGKLKNLELIVGNRFMEYYGKHQNSLNEFNYLVVGELFNIIDVLKNTGSVVLRAFELEDHTEDVRRIMSKL